MVRRWLLLWIIARRRVISAGVRIFHGRLAAYSGMAAREAKGARQEGMRSLLALSRIGGERSSSQLKKASAVA